MKMSRWSKAAISRVCVRQQHAVAEHVARHVADADDGEGRGLDVAVHLAEMPLHRFPGALGGDAHLLVVVAGRAAAGEGVVEPEAMLLADGVGGVGEGRRALVGGDDEIGIVLVAPHHAGRRNDVVDVDIVGDRQQAGDEVLVGRRAGFEDRVATGAHRQLLRIETALGADRHDDGILDLLRLDQAEHLGAVVLGAVRPAQAAAGHRAEAQMHALDLGAVDEDLPPRPRRRQAVDRMRIELDRQRLAFLLRIGNEMIGAQRGFDQVQIAADDGVVIDVGNVFQRVLDLGLEMLCRHRAFRLRPSVRGGRRTAHAGRARCRDSG